MEKDHVNLLIGAQPMRLSLLKIACLLNLGHTKINLLSVGQSVSKAFECASFFTEQYPKQIKVEKISTDIARIQPPSYMMENLQGKSDSKFTCVSILLSQSDRGWKVPYSYNHTEDNAKSLPVSFAAIEMMLNNVLQNKGEIKISPKNQEKRSPQYSFTSLDEVGFKINWDKSKSQIPYGLLPVLTRSGMMFSPDWSKACVQLGHQDDVILGLDTNILKNCIITRQLIDGFSLNSPKSYTHTPNWVLLVIPQTVMHELEYAANHRDMKSGYLDHIGRTGFRGLAEVFQLRSLDIAGLSIMICGSADTALNIRDEIRLFRHDVAQLRRDMLNTVRATGDSQPEIEHVTISHDGLRKLSSGDTIIRDQYKEFLRQNTFHKGAYFFTSDRANHALCLSEAMSSIYYAGTTKKQISLQGIKLPKVIFQFLHGEQVVESQEVAIPVTLARVVYEMAVEYGPLKLSYDDAESPIMLRTDLLGNLNHWVNERFFIERDDLKKLAESYSGFPIEDIEKVWAHPLWNSAFEEDFDEH